MISSPRSCPSCGKVFATFVRARDRRCGRCGWSGAPVGRPPAPKRACVSCGERWAQDKSGLCRQCRRANGDERTHAELQSERARREPTPLQYANTMPRQRVFKVVDGRTVEVMWP